MSLTAWRYDPTPCGFPRPHVPVLPPPTAAQFTVTAQALPLGVRHYARGRYALRAAYQACGVGPGRALLAPAYHCRTMLDPALSLGAEVILYPLTASLDPRPDGLREAIAHCRQRPAAMLFTHYFGLPREIAPVARWCRDEGIALVEDCSHALPVALGGDEARPAMGATGRFAVASPYKFFACPDGGWLWSNDGSATPSPTRHPGTRAELGALRDLLRALGSPRWHPQPALVESDWQAALARSLLRGRDWIDESGDLSADYTRDHEQVSSLVVSRWLQRHSRADVVVRRRRERWLQWVDATRALPGCRPLQTALPPGSTPYMFALQFDDPAQAFHPLKQLGVPIWRWDDMAISGCEVSRRYRQGLFHLPCHQSLSDEQMNWLVRSVARATRAAA